MVNLISLELFKLRRTKYFWVISGLFLLFLLSVPIASKEFMDFLGRQGETMFGTGLAANEMPFFDFIDIWQNLTWIYKSFSILLGFIVVISVCNEFSYNTAKQNVIDGLSRNQFLTSKVGFILLSSLVVSAVVFLIGLVMGLLWSPVKDVSFIFERIEFIPAYFIHLVAFQMLCLFLALLIKRSGFVLALLIFWVYPIENILAALAKYHYKMEWLSDLLPAQAIGNVIRLPFSKYVLQETQTFVGMKDVVILLIYLLLLTWGCYRLIRKGRLA